MNDRIIEHLYDRLSTTSYYREAEAFDAYTAALGIVVNPPRFAAHLSIAAALRALGVATTPTGRTVTPILEAVAGAALALFLGACSTGASEPSTVQRAQCAAYERAVYIADGYPVSVTGGFAAEEELAAACGCALDLRADVVRCAGAR